MLDGRKVLISGVMPASFDFPPGAAQPAEAWSALQLTPQQMTQFGSHFLSLVAHLKPGISVEKARAYLPQIELAMSAGSASVFQMHRIDHAFHPLSLYGFQADVIGDARPAMFLLLGAVAFFLLIACVNVSSLLLARADARRREIAVRRAIGAGGPMLIRQFAVEGLVLAGAGGTLGVLLAWIGVRYLATTNAGLIPRIRDISVDWHVLLFALAVAVVSGLVFCMTPMFQSLQAPLNACLNAASGRSAGSRVSNRLRAALVVAEISLALVLLIGSGLLTRALLNLQQVRAGFRSEHVLTAQLSLSGQSFRNADYQRQFLIRLRQRLESLPGVEASSITAGLPPERPENDNDTTIENFVPRQGGPIQNVAFYQAVEWHFVGAIGATLMEGRFFDAREGQDAPGAAIVNRTMANLFWPGQSAIGKRLKPGAGNNWATVIGVVEDIRNAGLGKPAATELFLPWTQNPGGFGSAYIVARAKGDPAQLATALRTAVREMDSGGAGFAHPSHGGSDGRSPLSAAIPRRDTDDLFDPRAYARGSGSLRGGVLFGQPAHRGIRHPNGARGQWRRRAQPGVAGRHAAFRARSWYWTGGRCSRYTGDAEPVVSGKPVRSDDFRDHGNYSHCGGAGRVRDSGPARHHSGPHARAALRITALQLLSLIRDRRSAPFPGLPCFPRR